MTQTKTQQFNPQTLQSGGQVFTIWSDKVVNSRLDCFYWMPNVHLTKLAGSKFEIKKIKDIVESIKSGTTPKQGEEPFGESDCYFIRNTELQDSFITLENAKTIKPEIYQKYSALQLQKGDVLVCIAGTIGISGVFNIDEKAIFNQNVSRIRFKKDVLPEYANLWFNSEIFLSLIDQNATQATIKYINNDVLGNLPIPLPSLAIQNKIVEIMAKAYAEKKEKENAAEKLLGSIDDFVLAELEIKMSDIENKMSFIVYSDEVEGRRIDPKAYLEKPKEILKAIKKSKYKSKELSEIISQNIAGEWGEDPLFTEHTDNYILANVLRNTNFDNKFNLNMDDVAQRLITEDKFEKVKLQKGDILIEKSGGSPIQPVGRVAIIENDSDNFTFSNFLQNSRVDKKECLPYYLFAYLKTIYNLGYMEYVQNQTTGIKNLIMEEYLSIPVLLPSLTIQNKIVEKVKQYYSQSKTLQNEARGVLVQAKEKVEQMILG